MENVPADYLIWLYDQGLENHPDLKEYIEKNRSCLDWEIDRKERNRT